MKLAKIGLISVAGFVLLALIGLGLIGWLLSTERGTAWAIATAQSRAPIEVSIGDVQGTFLDGVILNDIRLVVGNDLVTIEALAALWYPRDLTRGVLTFDEVAVTTANYIQGDPAASTESDGSFSTPVRIVLSQGSVESLVIETGDQQLVFDDTALAIELYGDRLLVHELSTRVEGADVRTRGELRFTQNLSIVAEFAWSRLTDEYEARGEGTLNGELPQLELQHELFAPFQMLTDGEILIADTVAADLELQWTDFAWPNVTIVTSPTGSVRVTGNIEAYDFNGEGEVVIDGSAALFEIDGSGSPVAVLLDALALSSSEGNLAAAGDINLDPVEWSLDIRAENIDPGQRYADWPGTLQGQALFQGRIEPVLEWSAREVELSGVLRDLPVTATGSVSSTSDLWQLDGMRLQSGPNVVTANGTVAETLNMSVSADAPEAAALWPELSGAVQLEALIGGTLSAPSVEGALQGRGLRWREYSVDQISVAAAAAPEDAAPLDIVLNGRGIEWNNLTVQSIQATVTGLNATHEIELDLVSEQWAGRLLASGGLTPSGWVGSVDALTVDQDALGEWLLTESTAIGMETGIVSVADFCVIQNLASLCGAARLSGAASDQIALNAANFDLRTLQPLLPETLSVEGVYDAELSLTGPMTLPNGTLSITGGPTRAGIQESQGTSREARFDELTLDAVLTGDSLTMTGSLSGQETGALSLVADVDGVHTDDPAVRAELEASWNDISFLSVLSPDVGEVSGAVSLDVTIDGTLNSPQVQGRARMSGGAVSVPAWGLDLREIEASANNTDLQTIEFAATGWAGEGRAELNGTTTLDRTAGLITILTLRGESLEVVRLPEAEVDLSPELDIRVELPDVQVTGTVHVPRAQLSLSELPEQAVSPSADAVIHGIETTEEFRPIRMLAVLELTLGDDVTYSGGGLTTFVSGNMNLDYESGRAAIASGVVELAGNYEISGQSLTLERGRLLFSGALDNPGLDVRAVRQIESRVAPSVPGTPSSDRQALPSANTTLVTSFSQAREIRAGVELTGTLQAPQTRLFSEPAMSEADVLSYLLFGRPLTGTGGAEAATLESTAVSMGLRRALPVIQTVGESVGLDELTVHTTNADAGELMAGKFLSPRLYVRYTYGLFNRVGGLMLHYRLTDRFSLETRSGDEESMDILYVVEKD